MAKTLELISSVTNFMKFMDNIQSSSPLTLRAYEIDLRQTFPEFDFFEGHFSSTNREEFSRQPSISMSESELLDHVRQAQQRWGKLSPASRNRKAATLKSYFSWAYQESLLDHDLADRIVCPRVPQRIPHFLSVDEILSVLKSFDANPTEHQRFERLLILLLYGGGLRVSEACGLAWKDFDSSRRVLRVKGKGSKERLVPLPPMSAQALESIRALTGTKHFVFGDKALSTRVAYEWVRSRGVIAGLTQSLHPHALRHSYATHMLSDGANLRTLQELLGHESLRATEKYTHLGVDHLARTLEAFHPMGNAARKAK